MRSMGDSKLSPLSNLSTNTMQAKNGTSPTEHHVAVFAFPFGTHAVPLLSLVRKLAAAAPEVRFLFFGTARSNGKLFSGVNIVDNIKPCNVWDGLPEGHVPSRNPNEGVEMFLRAMPDNFKKGLDEVVAESGRKISCFLTDAFLSFAGEMAEDMGVPWVPLWTAGPCSVSAHLYTDEIRQKIGQNGIAGREGETLNFIPGFSAIGLSDLPEGVISGNLESGFSCMLHNMARMLPRATAVAINSFEELDPTITNDLKSKLQKFLNIGPFTLTSPPPSIADEHGCLPWLDKHEASSVAYISFGSEITPASNEIMALAEVLEESGVPFLWSFRGNMEELLPRGFLERTSANGKVVPWAPQLQVLQHPSISVFATHCGWNSVTESIIGGVPMVCRPFFGDQALNRKVVEDVWKIGVGVEGGVFTKSGLMKAFERTLRQEEGIKMRENMGVLKELAIKAVRSNGSSVENFKTLLRVVTKSN